MTLCPIFQTGIINVFKELVQSSVRNIFLNNLICITGQDYSQPEKGAIPVPVGVCTNRRFTCDGTGHRVKRTNSLTLNSSTKYKC